MVKKLSNPEVNRVIEDIKEGADNSRDFNKKIVGVFSDWCKNCGVTIKEVSILNLFEQLCDIDPDSPVDRTNADAVAEAITSTAFPTIFNRLIFNQVWDSYSFAIGDTMQLVYEVDGQNVKKERIPAFTGLDSFDEVKQTQMYPEDIIAERFALIETHKIGKIVSLSLELLLGDQTASIGKKASDVGRKFAETLALFVTEKALGIACSLTGEAATSNFIIDGSAATLFSHDHSAIDGQVNDNISAVAFSTAGITALRNLLKSMTDPRGEKITVIPRQLVVPSELWQQAVQLVESINQYDTANNAVNPYKSMLKVIELVHLTSSTQYYMGDFPAQTWAIWDWRPKLDTQGNTSDASFERDIVSRSKFSCCVGVGALDHRFAGRGAS